MAFAARALLSEWDCELFLEKMTLRLPSLATILPLPLTKCRYILGASQSSKPRSFFRQHAVERIRYHCHNDIKVDLDENWR